jgi:signal transduction histidine kinase
MFKQRAASLWGMAFAALLALPLAFNGNAQTAPLHPKPLYQYQETRDLVALVNSAAGLVGAKGEMAFADFRLSGSRWRQGETYIFVLDPQGNMLVHPDPAMEGKNELNLKDTNGKPIIRGLIDAATASPNKPAGWYHYQWLIPGDILPRWKSSYVRLVTAPSGKSYVVGSGVYNDRMERNFVVDEVRAAIGEIEKNGAAAFPLFHDPTGPFIAKDAYIFVYDMNGVNLVLPPFPTLEGQKLWDVKDTKGKLFIQEMIQAVQTSGSGWVDYMWPKPGESVSTLKSSYVSKVKMGDQWVLVGCGVYLADAPKAVQVAGKLTAPELMTLVREGAVVFEKKGKKAFPEFREKGSKWFHDNTYFFVWTMDGTRIFNAAVPAGEGKNVSDLKDFLGRSIGKMFTEAAATPSGEGWVHYLYPEPGSLFPAWKSTFVKRVTFPSGKQYIIGCGVYNMQMDKAIVEDMVNRAAALIASQGKAAFGQLRGKKSPFVFMDTYVFVDRIDGTELVNPVQPSLEGRNLINLKDAKGKLVLQEEIAAAMKNGSAWLDLSWYKPGDNTPARKQVYVRKVQSGQDTYIVGSGVYLE